MQTERPAHAETGRPRDFKALYRKLERTLAGIERTENPTVLLETVLRTLVLDFHEDLGFEMGRLYRREDEDFFLCCAYGGSRPAPIGRRVPPDYPPHLRTLREGILVMRLGEVGYDPDFERAVGVSSTFAAIAIGPGNSHVLAFTVDGEIREEQILYSLTAVRHVINLKLQERKLAGILQEARLIQESLLPASAPPFEGFELHGRSRPAEIVGGDVYDYLSLEGGLLGLAIADASGHGLPAALLARDIITGLRLVGEEKPHVARTVERRNRLIHRTTLSSKFVSLFFGELKPSGALTYCNAGHNPPLLRHGTTVRRLERGGLVLGPNPQERYAVGRTRLERGDILLLYTDGFVEQRNARGEEFGLARLRQLLRADGGRSAEAMVEGVFAEVDAFSEGTPVLDDQTLVVVRRI